MQKLFNSSMNIEDRLIKIRRRLHAAAEGGFELCQTFEIIESELRALGITPKRIGKGSITATIGEGEECVLLRADCDAVSVRESSGEGFASLGEYSHACGHDMHTAMLLGAAALIKERERELCRPVKLLFQGAEEHLLGAADAIESGVLECPRVISAMSLHVLVCLPYEVGTLLLPTEVRSAPCADFFEIRIFGSSSHGAAAHLSADATAVGARILLALEELVAKETAPLFASAVTVGSFHSGSAPNVMSDECRLLGSLRTLDEGERERMRARIKKISECIAEAFNTRASLTLLGGAPVLKNDRRLSLSLRSILSREPRIKTLLTSEISDEGRRTLGGSEDFASIAERVPSILLGVAAGKSEEGYNYPLHHPSVRFDERALPSGALSYAAFALFVE